MKKVAFITGITGQDGSYLAELLLKKNYIVHGIIRKASNFNTQRIEHIYESPEKKNKNLILHYGDLTDSLNLNLLLSKIKPDEIYNLGAQSHVATSFVTPEYTANVNALGTLRILESINILNLNNKTKFYQASTSELFGNSKNLQQNEKTPFKPRSPYAVSKLFAYWITKNYREAYNIFASNGILFNHESPRRSETFVTRKITRQLSRIYLGKEKFLSIGNLDSKRDWGHAKDYVYLQWKILQMKKPDDFVISTDKQYSVRQFIELSSNRLGFAIKWKGKGLKEVGYISKIFNKNKYLKKNQVVVKVNKRYFRPTEVNSLLGDSSYAKKILKWKPKHSINDLVNEMITSDLTIEKGNQNI